MKSQFQIEADRIAEQFAADIARITAGKTPEEVEAALTIALQKAFEPTSPPP